MVIEHVFVTTLEAAEALRLASEFLTARGFAVQGQNAFQMGGWTTLEVARGKQNATRAKSIEELPQRIKVEWDRGRVTVAAYIQAYARATFGVGSGLELPANSPKVRLHAQLMTAIVQGLELLLAHRRPAGEAYVQWDGVGAFVAEDARRRRRRSRTAITILVLIFVALIALVIYANMRSSPNYGQSGVPSRPAVSGWPVIRFAFCTAWPAAPFPRLSIAPSAMTSPRSRSAA
jgi:hypothetical protein